MTRAPETERSYDAIDVLLFVWRAVMILLAGVIGTYGYLTVVTAETAKCAGQPWLAGYWAGSAFKLSLLPLTSIVAIAWILVHFRRARINELLSAAHYSRTWFRLGPIRITTGMLVLFGGTLGCPILLARPTEFYVTRYHAIADYCQTKTASSRSKTGRVAMEGGLTDRALSGGTPPRASEPWHESSKLGWQYCKA